MKFKINEEWIKEFDYMKSEFKNSANYWIKYEDVITISFIRLSLLVNYKYFKEKRSVEVENLLSKSDYSLFLMIKNENSDDLKIINKTIIPLKRCELLNAGYFMDEIFRDNNGEAERDRYINQHLFYPSLDIIENDENIFEFRYTVTTAFKNNFIEGANCPEYDFTSIVLDRDLVDINENKNTYLEDIKDEQKKELFKRTFTTCLVSYLVKNLWHNYVHRKLQNITDYNYRLLKGNARFISDFKADNYGTMAFVSSYGLPVNTNYKKRTEYFLNECVRLLKINKSNLLFVKRSFKENQKILNNQENNVQSDLLKLDRDGSSLFDHAKNQANNYSLERNWVDIRRVFNHVVGWIIAEGHPIHDLEIYLSEEPGHEGRIIFKMNDEYFVTKTKIEDIKNPKRLTRDNSTIPNQAKQLADENGLYKNYSEEKNRQNNRLNNISNELTNNIKDKYENSTYAEYHNKVLQLTFDMLAIKDGINAIFEFHEKSSKSQESESGNNNEISDDSSTPKPKVA